MKKKKKKKKTDFLVDKREAILQVAAKYGAQKVKIFGSVPRGEATPTSDLDLLVKFEPGYSLFDLIALKQDLEDLLDCEVDVVTEAALSPYLREEVIREATPL